MKNINLIRKVAWSFHQTTGLDWDDLFQESAIAYLEALQTYNKRKGQLSTYTWHCMLSRLRNYWRLEKGFQAPLCDIETIFNKGCELERLWEKIPKDLTKQVSIILENAHLLDSFFLAGQTNHWIESVNDNEKRHEARLTVRRLLREAGYDRKQINKTINKIQSAVKRF
jgi:DNA-directed RNA polymerase specialized sigma24 family protein